MVGSMCQIQDTIRYTRFQTGAAAIACKNERYFLKHTNSVCFFVMLLTLLCSVLWVPVVVSAWLQAVLPVSLLVVLPAIIILHTLGIIKK